MQIVRKCRAAVGDHSAMELAHMRVAHGRGDAAIGDDAGEVKMLDAAFAQTPLEPRGVECRIRDLLDGDVGGRELLDELLAPASRRKVAFGEERPQRFEMRRDDRLAAAAGHEREQGCDNQNVVLARRAHQRRETIGQGGNVQAGLAGAAIRALRMQEIVLQIAEDERGGLLAHAGSTITLPSVSTRPMWPGSITVVASGCSRIAGPSMVAPAGNASRDQTLVSRQPPSNQTLRAPVFAFSSDADISGANTEKSNAGRRPIAATRSDTMRTANPGSKRLNDAE